MPFDFWGWDISWRVSIAVALILVLLVFHIVPYWRIVRRAGFGGAWSLFHFVPLAGLVLLWVFAFIPWPVEGERRE